MCRKSGEIESLWKNGGVVFSARFVGDLGAGNSGSHLHSARGSGRRSQASATRWRTAEGRGKNIRRLRLAAAPRPLTRAGGPLCDVTISCWSVRICVVSPSAAAAAARGVRLRALLSPGQSRVCGPGCEHRRPGDARPHNYLSAPVAGAAPGESRPRGWGLRAPQDTPCAPLSVLCLSLPAAAGAAFSAPYWLPQAGGP